MKRGVLVLVGSLLFAMGFCVNAAVPVTVMDLKTIKPVDTFYTGALEAMEKGTLSFEESGILDFIVPAGTYVFSEITDFKTGEILRKGTVLAKQKIEKKKYGFRIALMSKKMAEADFLASQRDYNRNKTLVARDAVSKKVFNDSKTDLMNKKLALDKAVNELMVKQYLLDRATIIAPFSGMVTKSYSQVGAKIGDGSSTVEVTKMSPLLIKIPFPKDIIDSFKEGTDIKVFRSGKHDSVDGWCNTSMTENLLYAYVNNKVIPTVKLTPEQNKLKKVFKFYPIIPLSDSSRVIGELGNVLNLPKIDMPLAVPVKAIRTDKDGTYVLKANRDGKKDLFEFTVSKIYIELGDVKRVFNLGLGREEEIQSLKNANGLTSNDLIIFAGDKNIQDGETVIKENVGWEFMPGQLVKISIPALNQPGIYVPADAVINQVDGINYVYLAVDGKAKLTKVEIIGRSSGHNRIVGKGIKDGAQVIVMDRDNEYKELYDGVALEVKKTLPAPERITKARVDKLALPVSDIEKTYYK